MLDLIYSTKFRRDVKKCLKQGRDYKLLENVINILRIPAPLPEKYRDHPLIGENPPKRDCHILPDWVLIYGYVDNKLKLYRTGSHSELFRP